MTVAASDRGWFEHLSGDDLRLLSGVASSAGVDPDDLRTHPDTLGRVMAHPVAFDSVFAPADGEALAFTSPFLSFALIVHRSWAELRTARGRAELLTDRHLFTNRTDWFEEPTS